MFVIEKSTGMGTQTIADLSTDIGTMLNAQTERMAVFIAERIEPFLKCGHENAAAALSRRG